jgi:DNA polymerase
LERVAQSVRPRFDVQHAERAGSVKKETGIVSATASSAKHGSSIERAARDSALFGETHATMDFETRSAANLKKVGGFRYAVDESTSVLCLAYRLPGQPIKLWHPWLEDEEPDDLLEWIASGGLVEAHNAEFEYAIWNLHCVRKYHWPRLAPSQLRCSAAKGAALALPRALEDLGSALRLSVQKDMEGRRLMLKMSKPRKATKKDASPWHEGIDELDRLLAYCETDVLTEELASKKLYPLLKREQKSWELTLRMNERGIYCDVDLCKVAVQFADAYQKELTNELFALTGGEVGTVKQVAKFRDFLKREGVDIPNLQAGTVAETLKSAVDMSPIARRMLEIRSALGKSSITKFKAMIAMAGPDQRLRGTLLWHGASTGRWAGRGIQPQNFAKAKIKDVHNVFAALEFGDYDFFKCLFPDVFTALSAALRGMLCAPPGHDLCAADYSAIEARVVMWLAGDEENLSVYHRKEDPYKYMAAKIFGVPYERVTKEQRELGKRAVLGCGFGMGKDKFHFTCGAQGFPITEELAAQAVEAYREQYAMVKNYWYDLERVAVRAIRTPGKVFKFRNLQWLYRGGYLFCQLPSGRRLAYPEPKIARVEKPWGLRDEISFMAVDTKTKKWKREATYGGKLTENVTQAVARDVMNEAMFRAERAGYPIILTVHDEVVAEVPEHFGSLEEFEKLLSESPRWADGLPIAVEGWREKRYKK